MFFVLLCVHVSWLNMCGGMNVLCIYMCVFGGKISQVSFFKTLVVFDTGSLIETQGLSIKLGWLASEPRDSSVSVFQHWNQKSTHSFPAFYTGAWY